MCSQLDQAQNNKEGLEKREQEKKWLVQSRSLWWNLF